MKDKGYFGTLTSLKGLFILIIVLHNTLAVTPLFSGVPGTAFLILFGGSLGNSMFFLLSGFLLSVGYRNRIQSHSVPFGTYLRRRLQKLYPMYILSSAAALAIDLLRYGISALNLEKLIFTVLLIGGCYNSPTWFLCILFRCYIVYFAVAYFAKSSTHYFSYLALCVLVGYIVMAGEWNLPFFTSGCGIGFMNFFLGCILAEVYPVISEKLHRWLQPLFLVLVPLLAYLMLAYGVEIIAGDVRIAFGWVMCPMVIYLALVKGPCSWILRRKWLESLGKISSAIFFWHLVLYFAFCDGYALITRGGSVQEQQYLVYFVLMIALSAGFFKLEESWNRRKIGEKHPV